MKKLLVTAILICISLLYIFWQPEQAFPALNRFEAFPVSSIGCPGTLVLFDIDETLITLPWPDFTWPFRLRILWNFPEFIHAERWEHVYSQLWQQANFILIEPTVVRLINNLKSHGCIVLGLTSMESGAYGVITSMPEWRYKTLIDFGIKFTQQFGNHTFTNLHEYHNNYPMLYKGILCANQQPKGAVLEAFLKQYNMHPKKIIFFEDSSSNLQSVKETCDRMKIPAELYQYTGAERYERWSADQMFLIIKNLIQ